MLMRTDPFREIDRITEQFFGTAARPAVMPLDAYRDGDWFYAAFDLPGVDPDSIDCTVERNVLTVRAERRRPAGDNVELVAAERPMGTFTRRLFLGDTLDTDKLEAGYDNGVLTLRIPVAERAKPRRVTVTATANGSGRKEINA
ncbi:Hsp20/alpha crystallin family protein [Micromonospora sp. NPDC023633]|uniref:Hsp20/alpha crystallin family protein n=1 Tax=Micromonospora sp. NPDC023633 TaxID=3154320 RepID=UPI0033FEEF90